MSAVPDTAGRRTLRLLGAVLDPGTHLQVLRLLNFWHYAHVQPRRRLRRGRGVSISPTVSFRNGERIAIGDHAHIGEFCSLWAGDGSGTISLGRHALLGPRVFITASNYATAAGVPIMYQPRLEADVTIGDDVWLGAGAIVLPGVSVGSGCVVAAGAVVNRDLPAGTIAAGVPARVVGHRK